MKNQKSIFWFSLIPFGKLRRLREIVVHWKLVYVISSFVHARALSLLIFYMSVTEDLHFKKPFKEPSQFQVSLVESVSMQANECLMEWYVKIYQFTIFKSWESWREIQQVYLGNCTIKPAKNCTFSRSLWLFQFKLLKVDFSIVIRIMTSK